MCVCVLVVRSVPKHEKLCPGPDLLQTVPTLVLNVDFLMIMRVKGPVGSVYCKPVKCDQVLIYCRQCLLLSWMLTFLWLYVSRDLWDPFIADSQCSCPCWWSSFIQTRDGYLVLVDDLLSYRIGTVTYKSSLRFTHIVCVCVICPVQIFMKGCFCDGVCVCVFVSRT